MTITMQAEVTEPFCNSTNKHCPFSRFFTLLSQSMHPSRLSHHPYLENSPSCIYP